MNTCAQAIFTKPSRSILTNPSQVPMPFAIPNAMQNKTKQSRLWPETRLFVAKPCPYRRFSLPWSCYSAATARGRRWTCRCHRTRCCWKAGQGNWWCPCLWPASCGCPSSVVTAWTNPSATSWTSTIPSPLLSKNKTFIFSFSFLFFFFQMALDQLPPSTITWHPPRTDRRGAVHTPAQRGPTTLLNHLAVPCHWAASETSLALPSISFLSRAVLFTIKPAGRNTRKTYETLAISQS